jgi:formyltetrahydrofolate hydrolase
LVGVDAAGEARYEERELDEGDVIAQGTIEVDG